MDSNQKTLLSIIGAIIGGGFIIVIIRFMGPFLSSLIGQRAPVGAYFLSIMLVLVAIAASVILKNKNYRTTIIVAAILTAFAGSLWTSADTDNYGEFRDGYFWHYSAYSGGFSNLTALNRFGVRVSPY